MEKQCFLDVTCWCSCCWAVGQRHTRVHAASPNWPVVFFTEEPPLLLSLCGKLHRAKPQWFLTTVRLLLGFYFLFIVSFFPLLLLLSFQNAAHCKWKSIGPRVMSWYKSAEHIIPGAFRFITAMCSSSARRGVMSRVPPCGAVIFGSQWCECRRTETTVRGEILGVLQNTSNNSSFEGD